MLRVDRTTNEIWLAAPLGAPLAKKLDAAQAATLRDALARLHDLGESHGAVDPAHVIVDEQGGVVLSYSPAPDVTATADLDRLALARIAENL